MSQDPQLQLEAALTSSPDDPEPDWYDITGRILWGDGGGDVTVQTGRQTELADIDPSRLAGTLKNNDGALTPMNTSAPAPFTGNWELGKRLRLVERFIEPDSLDTFDRAVSGGLGVNNSGISYELSGGTAANFNVSGGVGRLTLPSAAFPLGFRPLLPTDPANVELRACVDMPVVPAGASILAAQATCRFGTAGYYSFGLVFETDGTVSLFIARSSLSIKSGPAGFSRTPGTPVWMAARAIGTEFAVKAWLDGQPEPTSWTLVATDSATLTGGSVFFQSSTRAGSTLGAFDMLWHHAEVRELFPLFTGHLELPTVTVGLPGIDQPCSFSAIDRLGRIEGQTPLEGNLAEYIPRYGHDQGELVLHMPLSDPAGPWMAQNRPQTTTIVVDGFFDEPVPKEPGEMVIPAGSEGPPGDDQSYATWTPAFGPLGGGYYTGDAYLSLPVEIDVAANQTIAVSGWWKPKSEDTENTQPPPGLFELLGDASSFDSGTFAWILVYTADIDGAGPAPIRQVQGLVMDETFYTNGVPLNADGPDWDEWRLVTVRWNLATKLCEMWIGNNVVVTGLASNISVSPLGARFRRLKVGTLMNGPIAHLQVRVGADPMTRAEHLAQYRFGVMGLEGQTVGERVATVAAYAGMPASSVTIEPGASTPMQAISMAGKTGAELMREAARSGQDLLLVDPTGQTTLVPRQKRYNQPIAMTIPFGWLASKSMQYRPEPPISDVTATRTGRGSVTRYNRAASDRYTVRKQSFNLDSAVDADPGNLAAWTLRVYDRMRTRVPSLRINMRGRTDAERKQLLRLRIGDRIQLTNMPAGSPADVPDLIIQGIKHTVGKNKRVIEFNTSPVLGPAPGLPPACPVVGSAFIGPNTRLAY